MTPAAGYITDTGSDWAEAKVASTAKEGSMRGLDKHAKLADGSKGKAQRGEREHMSAGRDDERVKAQHMAHDNAKLESSVRTSVKKNGLGVDRFKSEVRPDGSVRFLTPPKDFDPFV